MSSATAASSLLLDARTGWRTGVADDVADGGARGLSLSAASGGPLALDSPQGTLGGLVLPPWLAVQDGIVFLLDRPNQRLKQFDARAGRFQVVETVEGPGHHLRQLDDARALGVLRRNLYLVERGGRRVQVFHLTTWALRHVLVAPESEWEPIDIAVGASTAYFLDQLHGRVFRHRYGSGEIDEVRLRFPRPAVSGAPLWSRLALDAAGRLYLLDVARSQLTVLSPEGELLGTVTQPDLVRDRFLAPAIRVDHQGRFCLPPSLLAPGPTPRVERPSPSPQLFDPTGRPVVVEPAEAAGPPSYASEGTWISDALDSRLYRCQWHALAFEVTLPVGTRLTLSTYTDDVALAPSAVSGLDEGSWTTSYATAGAMQADPAAPTPPVSTDALVRSREGRYLWVRALLRGDGYDTPRLTSLRVTYPRSSLRKFLPAVYSADDDSRDFLDRFLSIFQAELEGLERALADSPGLFDPAAVPDGFVDFLASWLGLALEGSWSPTQKRRLLAAAPVLYQHRGTPKGIVEYVRVYLENLTGLELDDGSFPVLVEGFRERHQLVVSGTTSQATASGERDRLGPTSLPLWSRRVVGRLQLGRYSRIGDVRLVSTGDPDRDVFHHYAHRFRVFVPSPWVRSEDDERLLRGSIEAEKPAHTAYDLELVEPRTTVGVQASLGLDTVLGDRPHVVLACGNAVGDLGARSQQRRASCRARLGTGLVLDSRPRTSLAGTAHGSGSQLDTNLALI